MSIAIERHGYVAIYLLTAIGLTRGGSSTVTIYSTYSNSQQSQLSQHLHREATEVYRLESTNYKNMAPANGLYNITSAAHNSYYPCIIPLVLSTTAIIPVKYHQYCPQQLLSLYSTTSAVHNKYYPCAIPPVLSTTAIYLHNTTSAVHNSYYPCTILPVLSTTAIIPVQYHQCCPQRLLSL